MYSIATSILALTALFYILGKAADLAISNLRAIAEKLGVGIFFLGLLMGFFTSFPEMAVGINAIINDVPNISLGNFFGGIMVLFGLILGVNVYVQRKINSEQDLTQFGLMLGFLFLPVLLGFNGYLGLLDGLLIIVGYFSILFWILHKQKHTLNMPRILDPRGILKHVFLFLIGIILVLLIANFTVSLTVELLSDLPLSKFVVGIIIFAIGTNFPEIIIAIRSWQKKLSELSLSSLIGSGMSNMLFVGIFSIMRPFRFTVDNSYYILFGGMAVLLITLFFFYKSGNALKRNEGLVLFLIYVLFIFLQIVFEEPVAGI